MPTYDEDGYRTDIKVGMIVEACNLHIGEVIDCDPVDDYCHIKSLFTGQIMNCSLYHCGVGEQTPEEVQLKCSIYASGGMKALGEYYEKLLKEQGVELNYPSNDQQQPVNHDQEEL